MNEIQVDENGKRNLIEFGPFASLGYQKSWGRKLRWSFLPEIGAQVPQEGGNKGIYRFRYFLRSDFSYRIWKFAPRLGMTLMNERISGPGGTTMLQNGGSNTYQEFTLPAGARTARSLTFDLGLEYFFARYHQRPISFRAQTLVFAPFNSMRRNVSYALMFTFYLGKQETNP